VAADSSALADALDDPRLEALLERAATGDERLHTRATRAYLVWRYLHVPGFNYGARAALDVCKSAVQMHGGIGFTHEHDIGLYLKRAMTLSARYGNAGLHRRRYAEYARGHV
jgi:alkylation response protein AidB-like acyl-CoA dehydrogenase